MAEEKKGPSIFLGTLIGYAISAVLGSAAVIGLSIHSGNASAVAGLKMLTAPGALGAYLGYVITVKRRQSRGVSGPYDEWAKFATSWMCATIGLIVIVGSLAAAIKLTYDKVMG